MFFQKNLRFSFATKKDFISLLYLCTRKLMEVWLSGLKRHIANVLNHIGSEGSKSPLASAETKLVWIMPSVWRFSAKSFCFRLIALWCNMNGNLYHCIYYVYVHNTAAQNL